MALNRLWSWLFGRSRIPTRRAQSAADEALKEAGAIIRERAEDFVPIEIWRHDETRERIEALQLGGIRDVLTRVATELREKDLFQLCNLTITGYDGDPRELYQIAEVRRWCRAAAELAPFLPLLLSELTVQWYVCSLVDIELVGDSGDRVKVSVSTAEVHALLNRAVIASRSFFKECGVKDADALIRHCVNRVFRDL